MATCETCLAISGRNMSQRHKRLEVSASNPEITSEAKKSTSNRTVRVEGDLKPGRHYPKRDTTPRRCRSDSSPEKDTTLLTSRRERPNTRNSTCSARSSYSIQSQGDTLPERELLSRFRHVYAGKGGWLHGSRGSVSPTTIVPWGSSGQRYRQEILRKLAKTFSKRASGKEYASVHVLNVDKLPVENVAGNSSSTSPSRTFETSAQPQSPLIAHRDIDEEISVPNVHDTTQAVVATYKNPSPFYRSNYADTIANDRERLKTAVEDHQQRNIPPGADNKDVSAPTSKSLSESEENPKINADTVLSNRLDVEDSDNTTNRDGMRGPPVPEDVTGGPNDGQCKDEVKRIAVSQDYEDWDIDHDSEIHKKTLHKANVNVERIIEDTGDMDMASNDGKVWLRHVRTQNNQYNGHDSQQQHRTGSKMSQSKHPSKRSYSRRESNASGRKSHLKTDKTAENVAGNMNLFSQLSVEAQKALNQTREEMGTVDVGGDKAPVSGTLHEMNKMLVERITRSGESIPDSPVPEEDKPDQDLQPPLITEDLPTSSRERKHKRSRDHNTVHTKLLPKSRVPETQVTNPSPSGPVTKSKFNTLPTETPTVKISTRYSKPGRLPQITSIDTTKLPRESDMSWKGQNDMRVPGPGQYKDTYLPPRILTREHTFKITPAGYDSRFSDMPLPVPEDDTPHEVKVKAISKCSEWINKYL